MAITQGPRMRRAQLIQSGGAVVIDDFLTADWFAALRDEGLERREMANEQRKDEPNLDGWRSGSPGRFLATAESGPILEEIYADAKVIARLEGLAGKKLKPTGKRASFSYYDRSGHYLGLHRDILTCDVTLIVCLDRQEGRTHSGALRIYPKAMRNRLEQIGPVTPHP